MYLHVYVVDIHVIEHVQYMSLSTCTCKIIIGLHMYGMSIYTCTHVKYL